MRDFLHSNLDLATCSSRSVQSRSPADQQRQGRRISQQRVDQEAAVMRDVVLKAGESRSGNAGLEQDSRWRRTDARSVEAHGHQVLRAGIDVENLSAVTAPARLS